MRLFIVSVSLSLLMFGCDFGKTQPPKQERTQQDGDKQPDKVSAADDKQPDKPTEKEPKPPIPLDKWNFAYAEKHWGAQLKKVEYEDNTTAKPPFKRYKLVLEFTHDLTVDELNAIKMPFKYGKVEICFFDADNVLKWKAEGFFIEGEITGKKGDAVRLFVDVKPPYKNEATFVRGELRAATKP